MAMILADLSPAGQLPSALRRPAMPETDIILSEKI